MITLQSAIRNLQSAIVLLAVFVPIFAQGGQSSTPSPRSLPAQAEDVEGILVPVPREIFRVLDQYHDVNWRGVQRSDLVRWKSRGDQVQIALLLGSVIAEGFVAMGAEDPVDVKRVGTKVLALARALGVEHSVLRRNRSIIDNTDRGDWEGARKEWDGVFSDLQQGLIEIKSKPLLQLVSLSGWLRGTEALCAMVAQDYSAEGAQLIRQPAMLNRLEEQLLAMPDKTRNHPMVVKMLSGLRKVRQIIEDPDAADLSKQTVKEIKKTCSDLVTLASHRPA